MSTLSAILVSFANIMPPKMADKIGECQRSFVIKDLEMKQHWKLCKMFKPQIQSSDFDILY